MQLNELMKLSIKGLRHSLTLVKGHSDFKVKCLTFGMYTQVSNSGPHGPLVLFSSGKDVLSREVVQPYITSCTPWRVSLNWWGGGGDGYL